MLLEYVGSDNDRSVRNVMPIAILAGDGPRRPATTYIQARCSIAKATRSFRLDRIRSLSDPATGEVFAADAWLAEQQLGGAQPFALFDDAPDEPEPAADPVTAPHAPRWPIWRAALLALVVGYLIGRVRLLHTLLVLFGVHQARWL